MQTRQQRMADDVGRDSDKDCLWVPDQTNTNSPTPQLVQNSAMTAARLRLLAKLSSTPMKLVIPAGGNYICMW